MSHQERVRIFLQWYNYLFDSFTDGYCSYVFLPYYVVCSIMDCVSKALGRGSLFVNIATLDAWNFSAALLAPFGTLASAYMGFADDISYTVLYGILARASATYGTGCKTRGSKFTAIVIAPFVEEYMRHSNGGYFIIWQEVLHKLLHLAIVLRNQPSVFGAHFLAMSPSLLMHFLNFYMGWSFTTRFVIHFLFNLLAVEYFASLAPGSVFSKTSLVNYDMEVDEIVELYNYYVSRNEFGKAEEIYAKIAFLDHAQMKSWFQSMFSSNTVPGSSMLGGVMDALKSVSIPITVQHKIGLEEGTAETMKTLAWLATTVCIVESMVRKDSPGQVGYAESLGKLAIVGAILGMLHYDTLYDMIKTFMGMSPQTSDSITPVNLLVDGAGMFLFGHMFSSVPHGSFTQLVTNFGKIGSTVTSVTIFAQRLIGWVTDLILYACSCFGIEVRMSNSPFSERIEEMCAFHDRILVLKDSTELVSHKEIDCLKRILAEGDDMLRHAEKNRLTPITREYIRSFMSRVRLTVSEVDRPDKVLGNRDRSPYVLYLCGPPGCGKSDSQKIMSELMTRHLVKDSLLEDYERNPEYYAPWVKSVSDKFCSALANKTDIVWFPDVLQSTDKAGDPSSEANMIIHLCSSEKMPAHMAEAHLKGKIFFSPRFAMFDGNFVGQHVELKSIAEIAALLRRFNKNCYIQCAAPGYRTANRSISYKLAATDLDENGCDAYTSMLDFSKVGPFLAEGGDPSDLWKFRRWDLETSKPIGDWLSFYEYIEHIVRDYDEYQKLGETVKVAFAPVKNRCLEILKRSAAQTHPRGGFVDLIEKNLSINRSYRCDVIRDAHKRKCTDDLYPHEMGVYDLLSTYAETPLEPDLLNCIEGIAPLHKEPQLLKLLQQTAFAYSEFGGINLISEFNAVRSLFTRVLGGIFTSYSSSLTEVYRKVPDSYFAMDYMLSKFPTFPLLTFKNGMVTCGILTSFLAAYYYFTSTKTNEEPLNKAKPQSVSNMSQSEIFVNKQLSQQLYMVMVVIPRDPDNKIVVYKELNYITMLRQRSGVTVSHCLQEPLYYHNTGLYVVNIHLFAFDDLERNFDRPSYVIPFGSIKIFDTKIPDLVVLDLGSSMPNQKDLFQHIPSRSQLDELISSENEYCIKIVHKPDDLVGVHKEIEGIGRKGQCEYMINKAFRCHFSGEYVVSSKAQVIRQLYAFQSTMNIDGTCGAVGFIKPDARLKKKHPKYNQPIPSMIHVSGASLGVEGYEVFIYKEAFPSVMSDTTYVPPTDQFHQLKDHYASFASIAAKHDMKVPTIPLVVDRDIAHDFTPRGQKFVADVVKQMPPLRSAIVKSVFHGALDDILPLEEPLHTARLSYQMVNGTPTSVVDANSVNYGKNPGGSITDSSFNVIKSCYNSALLANIEGVGSSNKVFTVSPIDLRKAYESVITGGEGENGARFSCIDRTKSIGSTLQFVSTVTSRHDIFGENVLPELGTSGDKMLYELVSSMHEKLLKGEDVVVVYKAAPKDELLPKSKAAQKTRLFSVGDLPWLILNVIYFRDIVAVFKMTRANTGFMPGTNPYDTREWGDLVNKLSQFDGKCAMLDLSKFDMSVSTLLLEAFKEMIPKVMDMLYSNSKGDFDVDIRIRAALLNKITDYVMLYDVGGKSKAVHFDRALCSGTYFTSLIGTYVNGLSAHASLVSIYLDKQTGQRLSINVASVTDLVKASGYVKDNIVTCLYGDDSAISSNNPRLFNVDDICQHLNLLFGLVATNESEGSPKIDSNGYVPIDVDSRIIGRGMRRDLEHGVTVAPLRSSSLRKIIDFDKTGHSLEIRRDKLDTFLREVSLHGFDLHSQVVRIIKPIAMRELNYASPYFDFMLAFGAITSDKFVPEWESGVEVVAQSSLRPAWMMARYSRKSPNSGKKMACLSLLLATPVFGTAGFICPGRESIMQPPSVNCINNHLCLESHWQTVKAPGVVETHFSISEAQSSSSEAMKGFIGASSTNDGVDSDAICSESGPTCFVDAAGIKTYSAMGGVASSVPDVTETISEFLRRPYNIANGSITTAYASETAIFSLPAIGNLVTVGNVLEVTAWTDKLKGYALMRGTFVMRFNLNTSPFMQVSLIHTHVPNAVQYSNVNSTIFTKLVQLFQLPHVIMTGEDTVVEYRVPLIGPYGYHVLGTGSNIGVGNIDWGSLTTTVLTPLKVGPNATITNADFQVFGYWEDVELAAQTIPQMSSKATKRRAGGKIVDRDTVDKPISGTLSAISVASNALSGIPVIGPFANSLSWVTGILSGAAGAFGFSKPLANSQFTINNPQPLRYIANSDGPDAAVPLATLSDNKTEFITDLSTTGEDEMSLMFLYTRVHYTDTIGWSTGAATGSTLFTKYIGPANMHGAVTNILTNTATYVHGGPMYYLGNIHTFWRGSIVVNFKIIKTNMHTGRLLIVFTPRPFDDTVVAPTITNSVWSLREVVDVRGQDEITLTLPFLVAPDYIEVRPKTLANSYVNTSGRLDVFVLNELRCTETVSSSVDIITTFSAGPDFEMACPTRGQYLCNSSGVQTGDNALFTSVPFLPQSSNKPVIVRSVAQSSSVMVQGTIGGMKDPSPDIGPSTRCIGERLASVKQLINRNSTGYLWSPTVARNVLITPNDIISCSNDLTSITPPNTIASQGILWGDMYAYVAGMYEYYKGSMIIDAYTGSTTGMYGTLVVNNNVYTPFATVSPYDNATTCTSTTNNVAYGPKASSIPTIMSVGNASAPNRFDAGMQSFVVPYYNTVRCSYVGNKSSATAPILGDRFRNKAALAVSGYNTTLGTTSRYSRRCGDDFQFAHFLACPPLLVRAP